MMFKVLDLRILLLLVLHSIFSSSLLTRVTFSQLQQSRINRNHNGVYSKNEHQFASSTGSDDLLEEGGKRDFFSEVGLNIDMDYFFASRSSAQINKFNYNVPPELLNDKRIHKAILTDLFSVDYARISTNVPDQKRNNLSKIYKERLMEVSFVGVGSQNVSRTAEKTRSQYLENVTCIFVAPAAAQQQQQLLALEVPLNPKKKDNFLSLLSSTYYNMSMSQASCLTLNSILVNNDGGLFDNLPWKTWSLVGGHNGNGDFDAARNRVNVKYRYGKRDAYERFLGKDWPARGNFMSWLKGSYGNPKESKDSPQKETDTIMFDQQARQVLIRRILELELEEAKSMLAEAEQELAIHLNQEKNGSITSKIGSSSLLSSRVALCKQKLQEAQQAWESVQQNLRERPGSSNSMAMEESHRSKVEQFILNQSKLMESMFNKQSKATKAPYRGAYGYASEVADFNTRDSYKGPFDLLIELIEQQLRSKIIAAALENTSYRVSEGIIQLGGVCIIQRQPPPKGSRGRIKIALETVDIPVQEEDEVASDDDEVKTGDVYLVECDAEEAVALSVAAGIPLSIEKTLWESLNSRISTSKVSLQDDFASGVLPKVYVEKNVDYSPLPYKTGDSKESYDSKTLSTSGASLTRYEIVENITTVEFYDSLSIEKKAEILLKSDFLSEQMPRPRVVLREYNSGKSFTLLDRLLLPLIDESVRGEYFLREARRRNDVEAIEKLKKSRSKRQMAKEMARLSREGGNPELAEMWENEADFQKSLRVDVTQNEGTYGSLLDKDEWYERQRLAWVSRMKNSGFST